MPRSGTTPRPPPVLDVARFIRKVDAERFLVSVEDAKLRGAYVDPAKGRIGFREWAERWFSSTAALRPSTRRDYRMLLDRQILPAFADATLVGVDALAVREWLAALVGGGCRRSGHAKPTKSWRRSSVPRSTAAGWPATSRQG
jgi:hypothetical protein